MNKYYQVLDKILATGKTQSNRKGNIQYLLNEVLVLTPADQLVGLLRIHSCELLSHLF